MARPKRQTVGNIFGNDVGDQPLTAIKSLYKQSEVCVRVNDMKTKAFIVRIGLQQECVLSLDKINRDSSSNSNGVIGECNVRYMLFADELALLRLNKSVLYCELDRFSDECLAEVESRHGASRPRQDFRVAKPRRDETRDFT